MLEKLQFYIDGKWVDPVTPKTLDVINPSNEEPFARISLGSKADVDKAVAAARRAFESFSRTTKKERVELLQSVMAAYQKRLPEIAEAIHLEMGAPMWLAKAAQAPAALGHIGATLQALIDFQFEVPRGKNQIRYEPVGVCGLITPWNWPINQIAAKVAPALAAGCTMILKPSEIAPLNGILFAQVMEDAGVPAGVFNLINGDGPGVGEAMSRHPDIDMMSFTGSTRAGIAVSKGAADTVKRVALELGGKSANIVLEDADFAQAVKAEMGGLMVNSGQSCNAPTRMFVPRKKQDEIAAMVKAAMEATKIGDGSPGSIGPVVSEAQYNKIQGLIQKGIEEGAKLVTGGLGRPEGVNRGYYVRPTLFADVDNHSTIAREEIFGPVLAMIPYDSEEQAIAMANDSLYGLSGYVQSGSIDHARAVAARLRTGNVHLNGAPVDFTVPFGGYKQSGNGREWGGEFGIEEFLETKAVVGYQTD
ncbi:aldehyde dehydrogenase family protein [Bradyrhizobium sp.]|uniref:aldehyde dehydrogenase family protein n=1 Tax=Bradyrhizobium sp. TaxID=376 RepID=UPI0023887D05|nr:aldehyde dehydrogenase family protein [Bradyrhizobium sp.]MDE1935606.1 aldehyde dehydrogenase family protein [Bradyrhizobium sp.]